MEERHVAVLLEDIRSNFKAFGEGLEGLHHKVDSIHSDMQDLRQKVDRVEVRVGVLEHKVDSIAGNVNDLRREFQEHREENAADFAGLRREFQEHRENTELHHVRKPRKKAN